MRILTQNHLTLCLKRLKRGERWTIGGQGFTFILAKVGKGKYASRSLSEEIKAGDVLVGNSADLGKIEAACDALVYWCFEVCFEHFVPLFAVTEMYLLRNALRGPQDGQTLRRRRIGGPRV